MTIGKSDFEVGMTNYAQKWKTSEIYQRKSAGGMHAEKNHQDCGTPPPRIGCWSDLYPPILSTNNKVTGATTNMLRKYNQNKRPTCQE